MMKRILSLVLCFVLVVGIMPVNTLATDNVNGEEITSGIQEVISEKKDDLMRSTASSEPEASSEPAASEPEASSEPAASEPEASSEPAASEPEASFALTKSSESAVVAVTGITLDQTTLEVGVGAEPVTLIATVTPEDATDKTVTWDSSEPGVVSVKDGVLTFGYMGEAVITATAGDFTATCAVTVGEGEITVYEYTGPTYQDAAIFCSDVHGSTSDLTSVLSGVKTSGVTYSSIGFVGDTCLTVAKTESAVNSGLGYTPTVTFSYAASHDTENSADINTNWDYSGEVEGVSDYYLVYTIRETDMQNNTTAEGDFTTWYSGLTDAEKKLPIFIMSHRPLHARRNDNANAADWYSAISAAAESSDITVFWAHNHTGETSADTNAYYVAKDGTETFTVYNGSTVVPNFTYMNAGYINANGQNPARKGVATTVRITSDSLIFQDYNSSGEYTNSSYSHNVTVAREFAASEPEVTLSFIAVSGDTEYTVGGNGLNLTVTATYSDGTTKDVTADATFEPSELTASGNHTVTASYGGQTASIEVKAYLYDEDVNSLIGVEAFSQGATALEVTWDDAADTVLKNKGIFTDYVVYDLALTNPGETAEYAMTIVDNMDASNLAVYHVAEDGTLTLVQHTIEDDCVVFTTSLTGTFAYGSVSVPEGYTLESITLAGIPTDLFVGGSLDLYDAVITATYTKEGAEDYVRQLTVYDYDENNFSGYDVNVAGAQTAVFTFEGVTATLDIHVWGEEFTVSDVTVHVGENEYGVTAANVAESTNANVATAVASVMKEGTYKAYDITLTYAENYEATEDTKTVTLPIPEGVTNPVVYHVPDDGSAAVNMNAVNNGDGTVTFTTTHFSTYAVGDGVTGDESDATVPGTPEQSVTTKVAEEVTVYKLVATPVSGKTYLIVNSANGTGYGLDGDTTGYATTAFSGGSDYYSTWDDTTKTGTAFSAGSDVYLTTSGAYLWTAGSNSFNIGYDSDGSMGTLVTNYTYTLNPANGTSGSWALSNNQLSISLVTTDSWFGSDTNATYYLSGGSTWSMSTTAANVYFYEPVTIYKVTDVTTTTPATPDATYHMDLTVDGNTVTNHAYTVTGVVNGSTAQMNAVFSTTADGTTTTLSGYPANGTFTVLSSSNEAVATIGTDGVLTFTGTAGTTLVQVEYTWTENGNTYVTQNYVVITAQTPVYSMTIVDPESNQVKIGATVTLEANITVDGTATTGTVTWSSSDETIATVSNSGVVTGVAAGNVTITATYTDPNGKTHTDTVDLEVVDAVYALEISKKTENEDGTYTTEPITKPIVIKNVDTLIANGTNTHSVWAVITADGEDMGTLTEEQLAKLTFTSTDESIATVDKNTGVVTFVGGEGTVYITASYEYAEGKFVTDTVQFSVSKSAYTLPADGTTDFPEYPNEGAIRYDKTATAVGNFSETGIAQVELSMTGVPYTTGSEIDVVVMLDMTGSMSDKGMSAAEEATVAFVEKIVKNEDGTYNENRVAVYAFNSGSSSPYELVSLKKIASDDELSTANTAIRTASTKQASGGTPFDEATKQCYDVLQAAKTDGTGNNRQQFCVFMSDGGPTTYYGSDEKTYYGGNNNSGDVKLTSCMSGYSSSTSSDWSFTLPTEYYTDAMKADGVTVYTVGLLLQTAPSNPAPYSSMTDSTYDSTTDSLTSIGSHYYFCSSILKQMATDSGKYIDIFNVDNASKATAAFESIAKSILQAATDITVEDQITDEYTMIFDIPTGSKDITGVTNDFYIEFVKYALDENHERTDSGTSITKLYLKNTDGVLSAASDKNGTAYAAPTFAQTTVGDKGTLYYWSTNSDDGDTGVSVTVEGTTYYFVSYGKEANSDGSAPDGWYNMTSGGYAYGTVDATTNMSENLVIATPYFVYNAATKMLYWTVDKLDTEEYALRYFLYLDQSATEIGTSNEVPSGPYPTNDHAYITYTNFNGNDCQQQFPIPQLTWNGAQVSYVFYLVNEAGQPINKSGQVVDFANATFITDVFTHHVVWNGNNAVEELNVEYLASNLLPDDYIIYDENAEYTIHVYQTAAGETVFDYFIIEGSAEGTVNAGNGNKVNSDDTTKVYNTKAGTKYSEYGIYSAEAVGTEFTTTDANGSEVTITTTKQVSMDYSDTTVAFAVVWKPALVPDTVVVDYGLDVLINVVENDLMQNTVSGIGLGKEAYGNTAMNTGVSTDAKLGTAALTTADGSTISIENENAVRFSQNDMTFEAPVTFYYESPVEYYEGSNKQEGYMYSSVTVIPATTIYYEDEFVTLKTYTSTGTTDENGDTIYTESVGWKINSVAATATQDQDRPGKSQISADIDADNNYGYDSAYESMSQYSMGSAAMTNVSSGTYATAEFEFYGTGFDIISLTDTTTGVIVVDVYDEAGEKVLTETVNNYYGYARKYYKVTYTYDAESESWEATTEENVTVLDTSETKPETPENGATYTVYETRWVTTTSNDPNALYQVPVLKIGDGDTTEVLTYGKYKAVITATYMSFLDKTTAEGYDFYLDAIRIYNPTGNLDSTANKAYTDDGEGWPTYYEVRNQIISKNTFDSLNDESVSGIVFIDGATTSGADDAASVADYVSYGPNNEVYLEAGNAVAFDLNATATAGKVAKIQLAVKTVGETGSVLVYGVDSDGTTTTVLDLDVSTATDMYYDVTALNGETMVIKNDGADPADAIISITNVKVTYTAAQTTTEDSGAETASEEDDSPAVFSIRRSTADAAVASLSVTEETPEETIPETTVPEETEPETSVPEETEPEDTEEIVSAVVEAVNNIINTIKNIFSKWFW